MSLSEMSLLVYLFGLLVLACYMHAEDNSVFSYKMNWIFLILYPIIFVYSVFMIGIFAVDGLITRKPPE